MSLPEVPSYTRSRTNLNRRPSTIVVGRSRWEGRRNEEEKEISKTLRRRRRRRSGPSEVTVTAGCRRRRRSNGRNNTDQYTQGRYIALPLHAHRTVCAFFHQTSPNPRNRPHCKAKFPRPIVTDADDCSFDGVKSSRSPDDVPPDYT